MLVLILAAKLVCEIALLCLAGRGVLAVLAGTGRDGNLVYGLFRTATQPFVRLVRPLTPRFVPVRQHPGVAFAVLAVVWLALTLTKIFWCLQIGVARCL
ncbi:MAG: hypothetical protein RJA09_346 [Pseudomonadota bacterium]|jgi:hypothetical protein